MLTEFKKFKSDIQQSGKDPKQMVMDLISSGKMSDETFNRLGEQAKGLISFLK